MIDITTKGKEEFEDTKGAVRIRISKKNRQHNSQKEKYERTKRSTKHTYKTKDRVTRFSTKAQYLSPKWQHILGQYTLMVSTESWPVNTHIQLTSSSESRICY